MDEVIEIGGRRILLCAREGALLRSAADANGFVGAAWSHEADLLAIPVERLGPDFLTLSTGVAGEVFQKFVNYHLGCAILGDIAALLERSRALRDFVRETNEGHALWFLPDVDLLRARLAGAGIG